MSRTKERPNRGLKLEVTVIPAKYLDWPLAEIIHHLGNGPLLWAGGAGRAQGLKFVPYEIKKKRGRKPKAQKKPVRSSSTGESG
ncbi:MAG: hypothetical protein FJ126_01560 [Deltaproteobacteria bacterium]|nr:hypothetical protein [Deltaproteobacteria bacterium]